MPMRPRHRLFDALPSPRTAPPPGPHLLDATMFWGPQPTGGVRRVLGAKRQHLLAAGWQHTLLLPAAPGQGPADAPSGSILTCGGLRLPRSGGYRFVTDRDRAVRLMVQAQPDLIEAADPFTLGWAAQDAAQRLGVPAVAFCHSHLPAQLERWARQWLGRWSGPTAAMLARRYLVHLYAGFDLVLAPSRTLTAQLSDWGLPRVQHQPLGVDCQVFHPEAAKGLMTGGLARQLDLPPATRLLLYCGRFAPEKRLPLLARAVEALGPGHLLLCIGSGPCPPAGAQVRTLPPEAEPARLAAMMAGSDAFVHAGNEETFGLAALEAMACGVPLVLCRHAGLGELGAGTALCVDSEHPADWSAAMRDALERPDAQRLARALARARAHDWRAVIEGLRSRYLGLMGQGAAHVADGAASLLDGRAPSRAATTPP